MKYLLLISFLIAGIIVYCSILDNMDLHKNCNKYGKKITIKETIKVTAYIIVVALYIYPTWGLYNPEYGVGSLGSVILVLGPAFYCLGYLLIKHMAAKMELRQDNICTSISETVDTNHVFPHDINSCCAYLYLFYGYIYLIYRFFLNCRISTDAQYLAFTVIYILLQYLAFVIINHMITKRMIAKNVIVVVEVLLFITLVVILLSDVVYDNHLLHDHIAGTCRLYLW